MADPRVSYTCGSFNNCCKNYPKCEGPHTLGYIRGNMFSATKVALCVGAFTVSLFLCVMCFFFSFVTQGT